MNDQLRDALQRAVDDSRPGWHVAHYVVIVGLERCDGDDVETSAMRYSPASQADYITDGLLLAANTDDAIAES